MTNVTVRLLDARTKIDANLIGVFEDAPERTATGLSSVHEALERARKAGFGGREQEVSEVLAADSRLLLVGLGKVDQFTRLRSLQWLDRCVHLASERYLERIGIVPAEHAESDGEAAALRHALRLAGAAYRFDTYRQGPVKGAGRLRSIALAPPNGHESAYRQALKLAASLIAGIAFARELGNSPPNIASPQWLAEQARHLAREQGMRLTVWGPRELERHGCGGLLAVGGGSSNPPRLVKLQWGTRGPRIALVGKGVTFDTGGISIKQSAGMEEMKYDKAGACNVLGIAKAVTSLGLPVRLSCFLPLAENMPDASAYRPGDIVRCCNGKTVEITNTDSEGRMILADALALAVEGKPDFLVEMSTLTGACVVALGEKAAAVYSPDDALAEGLLSAAELQGERLWRMPLWPEYLEQMKGVHADLKNSGARWGGANNAAAFLSQFVGEHASWAHLDIAGPAYATKPAVGWESGATGFGIASVVHWIRTVTAGKRTARSRSAGASRAPRRSRA